MDVTKRNISLDILRILACLAVITYHTPGLDGITRLATIGSLNWCIYTIYHYLSAWCVPIFMMLTGYLFMQPSKDLPLKKLYGKYILHILIVLVVWDVFYMWVNHDWSYHVLTNTTDLWYLGMLIGYYMVMPVMRQLALNINALRVFCWTWLGYLCYELIGKFVMLPIDVIDNIFVDSVGYGAWAYYLSVVTWNKNQKRMLYALGCLLLIFLPIITIFYPLIGAKLITYHSPLVAIVAISIFAWFYNNPIQIKSKFANLIMLASSVTLGAYVLHPWVQAYVFYKFLNHTHWLPVAPLFIVPASVFVCFIICGGISWLIKKIPYVGKWII